MEGTSDAFMPQLRIILLAIALVMGGLLGWQIVADPEAPFDHRFAFRAPLRPQPRAVTVLGDRAGVESRLALDASYRAFFDQFRTQFPADYDRMVDDFARQAALSGMPDSADAYLADAMALLRRTRGILGSRASDDRVEDVVAAQSALATALAGTDARLCVDFLYGTPGTRFDAFAATHRDLVGALAQSQLAAIVDGQTRRMERPNPSEADFSRVEADLTAKGLTSVEVQAVLDGRWPDPPLPDTRMCGAGQAYLDVVRALPEPLRAQLSALTVDLMARS